jgi:hypothetical protein
MTPPAKRCPKGEATMSPQFGRRLFCGDTDDAKNVVALPHLANLSVVERFSSRVTAFVHFQNQGVVL